LLDCCAVSLAKAYRAAISLHEREFSIMAKLTKKQHVAIIQLATAYTAYCQASAREGDELVSDKGYWGAALLKLQAELGVYMVREDALRSWIEMDNERIRKIAA
jgi:hypothetical protein